MVQVTQIPSNSALSRRRTLHGALGGLIGFVAMSVAAGVLVTASVTPVVALSGLAATNTISVFENLPDYVNIEPLSQKSDILATRSDGTVELLASFYDQNRIEVSWDAISQFAKDAAVSGEDPRFYEHGGVDLQGTLRATATTVAGGDTQGGSSITQQYVKNVLVQKCELLTDQRAHDACYTAATETTPDRKLKEMRLAIGVEKKYSKHDILRQYFNITGFGGTVYGIEAAANYYFNTTAALLTLPQAASLVAIVNNPVKFQLDQPASETNGAANGYAANKQRRDYILREMLRYKKLSRADFDAAIAAPVEPIVTEPSTGCQTAVGNAFFCDYVTKILQTDPTFGADAAARMLNFRRGGYDVYTTLDLDVQNAAVTTMNQQVPKVYAGGDVGAIITSVQVGTGRVLAMTQNKDYSQDPAVQATGANFTGINYATDYAEGGSSGFQPGSTYKVFTLAEWLKEGHSLNERVDSRRKANWGTFQDSCFGPQNYDKDEPPWNPRNDANESGANYSALQATVGSINTGFIGMAKRLDLCGIRQTAEAFGVHRADGNPLSQSAASVIGTNEIAPLTMAIAFAGIANKGVTCSPIAIDRIVGPDGVEVPVPPSVCSQSVDSTVAAGMAYAMRRVMLGGTGQQSNYNTNPNVPMIGKTGTTDGAKDTWMSGASTKVATVVAVVSLTGTLSQRRQFFGRDQIATARHRMWPVVMSAANAKYGGDAFEELAPKYIPPPKVVAPPVAAPPVDPAPPVAPPPGAPAPPGQ
ncbi:penicillin-binding protein [Cryobacterium sp. TMS1-20-1]|uniref:transglycosylase domain-containing protein n=1 Tax=Cryobacterium sp. TMS1-20-1 TaxID=1259223 RepID=UPI00106AAA84|nr:transglycosylase domain-containing protein [Cryobacterium sp. TMS1-20-1]TFC75621.1 penicillin-binding protein [Cryobacterium sp. TMS1-20-1]